MSGLWVFVRASIVSGEMNGSSVIFWYEGSSKVVEVSKELLGFWRKWEEGWRVR